MASSTAKSGFWRGLRTGAPFIIAVAPFGLLFGVIGTEAGLDLAEVMGFSIFVIAGASQFTAVSMMEGGAPLLAVLATSLAVNLRMGMYSAALVPYLGRASVWQRAFVAYLNVDQTYACSVAEYEARPAMSVGERVGFFFGVATPVAPTWFVVTLIGAVLGEAIPPSFALDFAVPITFLALVAPMLKTAAHVAAAVTSVVLALGLAGLPAGLGLLLAAAAAMVVGALVEVRAERAAVPRPAPAPGLGIADGDGSTPVAAGTAPAGEEQGRSPRQAAR